MARLPAVTREQLNEEDQGYFDSIVGTRGSIRGPYGVLLHSPKLAARVADTGAFVRYEFSIPEGLKEIVIITTAREMRSQYEFSAHAKLARAGGVSDETIKIIATGAAPEGLTGDEALLSGYVKEMLQQHKVSDATYKALVDRFGEQDTLHLAVLVGHYMLVAQVLATVDVELGEGMVAEIPE